MKMGHAIFIFKETIDFGNVDNFIKKCCPRPGKPRQLFAPLDPTTQKKGTENPRLFKIHYYF
ncbi:hypothetical protein ACTHOQ_10055 [Solibacillus silvestris]|uniref:hypothetical protein n=1 Tax=Solibacillus silvestris TaxID=76853 RepID=UPI003F7EE1DF